MTFIKEKIINKRRRNKAKNSNLFMSYSMKGGSMKTERPGADISIRLHEKKKLKDELLKIAKRNKISLNTLMINIIEWWLEEKGKRNFQIKLK